ncbi:TonB-dependent receptor [Niveispirillum fermenti]|uniref:TonB-dependent receptor n=1 Tax=Niveispirillum fermenti TaxID=1233113 RepID=UPI003A87A909
MTIVNNKKVAAVFRRHTSSLKFGAGVTALAIASAWAIPAVAQQTTSSMSGYVTTAEGLPAAGAVVEITHVPSGTRSTATVNAEGRFNAAGLRVGGPYNVRFNAEGVPPQVIEGVFISLGEPFQLNLALTGSDSIEEIVVTGDRVGTAVVGNGRSFSEDQIRNAPTVNRDLKSTLRLDPRVSLDATNLDAISIGGANTRFNQISVDGVRQSDDFGLNNNGYPTQRAPISLDAIEQLSVVTNPFDVEYSGFQGGLVNIVTKSGTNDFHGSAFYYYTDSDLTGDKSKSNRYTFNFKEKTYGGTLGGPIVKDKLFFFGSYEKLDAQTPQEYGPSDGAAPIKIPGVTQAEYDQVLGIAQRVYNYDAGALGATLPEKDEKILARIDWNIAEGHRATVSYQRTKGNQTSDTGNSVSGRTIATLGHLYDRSVTMDQYTAQLYSDWTDNFSTELKFGRKEVVTGQNSLRGVDFPEMEIKTAAGTVINIGPDEFRHANALTNDLNTYKAKGEYLWGDHTLTFGYEREELDIFNLFVSTSRGFYAFDSIADFEARRAASFRYNNALSNNADDAAATFGYKTNSLYLEDKWDITPDFELTYGLRYDWWESSDKPALNQVFTNRYGYDNTRTLDGLDLWSPRVGFKYQVNDDTTLSGGAGIFGGGSPNVWVSNSFSNTGVLTSNQSVTRNANGTFTLSPGVPASTTLGSAVLDNVTGNLPAELLARQGQLSGQGDVNAIAPGFEIPSEWQFALTVEHRFDIPGFGDDWRLTASGQYAKTRDAALWRNGRYVQNGTLPDGRPRYVLMTGAPSGNDLILDSTGKGSRLSISTMLDKRWDTDYGDVTTFVGYTYQDAKEVNPATSSTALSNWDNVAVSDMNDPELSTSNYEIKHRIVYAATWEKEWFTDLLSTISVVGESRTGRPYSYTFFGGGPNFNDPRQNSRNRQLFYVPGSCAEVNFAGGLTCEALNDFIARNGLEKYRGQIVPRNSHRSPWVHQIDLAMKQQVPAFFEGHKAAVTLDIRNVGNLINSKWGRLEQVGFPGVSPVLTPSVGADGKYTYTGPLREPSINANAKSSVWQIQVGVRYEF